MIFQVQNDMNSLRNEVANLVCIFFVKSNFPYLTNEKSIRLVATSCHNY